MKTKLFCAAAALNLCTSMTLQAAVNVEEAERLGNSLTPTGAEKAGNADGSIPEWTGGIATAPADFVPDSGIYNNPFADDEILYSVTHENMAEYDDLLSEGQKALLRKQGPDGYRLDVYPTHRTYAAPQWFYEGSKANATGATLEDNGQKVAGNVAGVPFPIPQTGLEALWNHMIRWMGYQLSFSTDSYYVDEKGKPVLASSDANFWDFPMFMPQNKPERDYRSKDLRWAYLRTNTSAPARRVGEILLVHEPGADYTGSKGRSAWQYLTGQRRVRKAPAVSFDTPQNSSAGTTTYDDAYMYNGSPERYDWKLLGKKEMLVPYNNYDAIFKHKTTDMLGEKFPKPGLVRFEKHRVWVVEGTLKEGVRHIYGKRRYLIDEDSWFILDSMRWDRKDNLWRVSYFYQAQMWDIPAPLGMGLESHDLLSNIYTLTGKPVPGTLKTAHDKPVSFFSPQGMARGGIR
jgi:hypothetical protein